MRHWTDGKSTIKSLKCPYEGWYIGRAKNENFKHSDERKNKQKENFSNGKMFWWNNGIINKRGYLAPNDGKNWVRGRLMSDELYSKFCKKRIKPPKGALI